MLSKKEEAGNSSSSGSGANVKFDIAQSNGDESVIKNRLDGGIRRKRQLSLSVPPTPWFGLDIGGTLTKLVYFEPQDENEVEISAEESVRARTIRHYLVMRKAYGRTGTRDDHLQLNNVEINGRRGVLHFIRFPTDSMNDFLALAKNRGFAQLSSTVCATGGGAIKYAKQAEYELNVHFHKADELESLIKGIEFVAATNPDECYYYENPLDNEKCEKVIWRWSSGRCSTSDLEEFEKKEGLQYPYIVCNIGSGVSVLAVRDHDDFVRVSGSSIGGGFFQGLCAIMCGSETFENSILLASKGDNKNVDKLVRDIYGTDYEQAGLTGDIVAASFGKIGSAKDLVDIRKEDLARSALVTTTNNIGSIAFGAAMAYKIDRIVFVGKGFVILNKLVEGFAQHFRNFLRVNPIAARLLSNAMTFWSKGTKKALFLNHEGYFGAVGCLDKLVYLTETRRQMRAEERQKEQNLVKQFQKSVSSS
uniref:pantothenate kinase n=1 Tax=Syphacia muris TaxID=451379 RepID=A0A0N5ALF5_9BILA